MVLELETANQRGLVLRLQSRPATRDPRRTAHRLHVDLMFSHSSSVADISEYDERRRRLRNLDEPWAPRWVAQSAEPRRNGQATISVCPFNFSPLLIMPKPNQRQQPIVCQVEGGSARAPMRCALVHVVQMQLVAPSWHGSLAMLLERHFIDHRKPLYAHVNYDCSTHPPVTVRAWCSCVTPSNMYQPSTGDATRHGQTSATGSLGIAVTVVSQPPLSRIISLPHPPSRHHR